MSTLQSTRAMLTRLYVDNYKCFSAFELALGSQQLLLGNNGTGKSSVLDVVAGLQAMLVGDATPSTCFGGSTRTRWDQRELQTFELDLRAPDAGDFRYSLVLALDSAKDTTRIQQESLVHDGRPIYRQDGELAELMVPGSGARVLVDQKRSGIPRLPATELVDRFRDLMEGIVVLRAWPPGMSASSTTEDDRLAIDGHNFSAWYRSLDQQQPFGTKQRLHEGLREALAGFDSLRFEKSGDKERRLVTQWSAESGTKSSAHFELGFDELSDGQRMLVVLYTLNSISSDPGPRTILLDEPTNYVGLSEIEPWLRAVEERVEDGELQAIIASHHPELLNAWARTEGIRFFRDAAGPVRSATFSTRDDDPLTPAERIARGWDDDA